MQTSCECTCVNPANKTQTNQDALQPKIAESAAGEEALLTTCTMHCIAQPCNFSNADNTFGTSQAVALIGVHHMSTFAAVMCSQWWQQRDRQTWICSNQHIQSRRLWERATSSMHLILIPCPPRNPPLKPKIIIARIQKASQYMAKFNSQLAIFRNCNTICLMQHGIQTRMLPNSSGSMSNNYFQISANKSIPAT